MKLNEYREKHAELKKALSDFENNLPDTLTIVGGQIEENNKVLFATLASYSEDDTHLKHIVFEPKDEVKFRKDLKVLVHGLHVEHFNELLPCLPIEKRMKHEMTYVATEDPVHSDEEVVIAKAELFESEEFLEAMTRVSENEPYHSLLLERLIQKHVSFQEEDIVEHIIFDNINSSEIFGHELDRVIFTRRTTDFDDERITYMIAIGEMPLADFEDYRASMNQHSVSYISFF